MLVAVSEVGYLAQIDVERCRVDIERLRRAHGDVIVACAAAGDVFVKHIIRADGEIIRKYGRSRKRRTGSRLKQELPGVCGIIARSQVQVEGDVITRSKGGELSGVVEVELVMHQIHKRRPIGKLSSVGHGAAHDIERNIGGGYGEGVFVIGRGFQPIVIRGTARKRSCGYVVVARVHRRGRAADGCQCGNAVVADYCAQVVIFRGAEGIVYRAEGRAAAALLQRVALTDIRNAVVHHIEVDGALSYLHFRGRSLSRHEHILARPACFGKCKRGERRPLICIGVHHAAPAGFFHRLISAVAIILQLQNRADNRIDVGI